MATESSLLLDLVCPGCLQHVSADRLQSFCAACGRTYLARYDLETAHRVLTPQTWAARASDLWRFQELLPVKDLRSKVTLGEGGTPILKLRDDEFAPGVDLLIKDDGLLPTGSFKARGMAVAVTRAKELGATSLTAPSAGNAGAALAAYACRAGLKATVYMPRNSPVGAQDQVRAYGGDLRLVEGHIGDAGRLARQDAAATGAFDLSTLREPYRAEGKKTMGFEIFMSLGRAGLPSAVVYPTGGGTGLLGMVQAFRQLRDLGWMDAPPRLYAAQAAGCAPVVDALQRHLSKVEPVAQPVTAASGLRVPAPFSSEDILQAIRSTDGGGVAVAETDLAAARQAMGRKHGLSMALEAGAAVAGLRALMAEGQIARGERVLVYSTGTGLTG